MEPPRFSLYDPIVDEYVAFVRAGLHDENSVLAIATRSLVSLLGTPTDLDVCDLACGEGHLTRLLARQCGSVIGVDMSAKLLDRARRQPTSIKAQYLQEDAQHLNSLPDSYFDVVVSNLALMDIPDLGGVFQSVARVLRSEGRFLFSITHPCFEAPHASTHTDAKGTFQARVIPRYIEEGAWASRNPEGIRSKVGAMHRTLATYLNSLIAAGFQLEQVVEPVGQGEQIPKVFVVAASVRNKQNE
jgi:ubiquinone/menaquinone biosynthesis C-methylase UbiE